MDEDPAILPVDRRSTSGRLLECAAVRGGETGTGLGAAAATSSSLSVQSDRGAGIRDAGRSVAERRLVVACGLAAALPIIVSTIRAVTEGWVPLGDDALIAVRSFEVLTTHPPLVGMPSTGPTGVLAEQTFHLGPLLFWLLALPAHFLGPSSLAVTVGLVNIASVMGIVALAHRRGGGPLMLSVAIAVPVMLASLPSENYSDVWNPAAPLLPFTLLIFLAWSLACGEYRLLPLSALVASFVAQCHLIYLLPVLGASAVGIAGLTLHRASVRRRWVVAALAVALVCWSGPLIDQIVNRPGNLVLLARAANADDPSLGPRVGGRAVVRAVGIPPWWLRDPRGALQRIEDLDTAPGAATVGSAVLVLAGLLAVVLVAWRRRRREVLAAGALALVLCAAIGLATVSVPSGSFASTGYGLWWASPVGMWVWLALGWSLAALLPAFPLPKAPRSGLVPVAGIGLAAVVGAIVAAGADPPEEPFREMRTITARLDGQLPEDSRVRVDASYDSVAVFTGAGFQLGIVYWLLHDGHAVTAPSLPDLGSRYDGSETEYDHVVRVDVDRPPIERGRLIARFALSIAEPDNPFSKAPAARTVAVTLIPAR